MKNLMVSIFFAKYYSRDIFLNIFLSGKIDPPLDSSVNTFIGKVDGVYLVQTWSLFKPGTPVS